MKQLNGKTFRDFVVGGAANLSEHIEEVNALNVFPIPDGDTGINMFKTISGGIFDGDEADKSISAVARNVSDGMLMSARGNSGVILSQFFAGIADGLSGVDEADVEKIASAFKSGVEYAYDSVIQPTEGTILTVAREGVDFAASRIGNSSTVETFFSDCLQGMKISLEKTPELLSVLKSAGVIDSGGAGLLYIIEGFFRVLKGEKIERLENAQNIAQTVDFSKFDENSVLDFGYCTEALLRLQNSKIDVKSFKIDELISFLQTIGDSIVAVQNGSIVKIHVHTKTPGEAFNFCQKFGEFLTVKVENMTLQHNEILVSTKKRNDAKKARKKFALVAVATGDGIRKTFLDLGADFVIDGGQGKNPSTHDFVHSFETVNADAIFVLPNNGNIVMAAKQAADLFKSADVRVIETRDIGEGYAALQMLDYSSQNADEIEAALNDAISGVITGMVAKSIRNANLNKMEIKKDDYIGFTSEKAFSSSHSKIDAANALLEKLNARNHEFIMVIYGIDATDEDRIDLQKKLRDSFPNVELYELDGGQKIYDFLLILQ